MSGGVGVETEWRPGAGPGWFTGAMSPPSVLAPPRAKPSLAHRPEPAADDLPAAPPPPRPGDAVCGNCPAYTPLRLPGVAEASIVAGRCGRRHRPGIVNRHLAACGQPASTADGGAP